jgi:hypothetical protein
MEGTNKCMHAKVLPLTIKPHTAMELGILSALRYASSAVTVSTA